MQEHLRWKSERVNSNQQQNEVSLNRSSTDDDDLFYRFLSGQEQNVINGIQRQRELSTRSVFEGRRDITDETNQTILNRGWGINPVADQPDNSGEDTTESNRSDGDTSESDGSDEDTNVSVNSDTRTAADSSVIHGQDEEGGWIELTAVGGFWPALEMIQADEMQRRRELVDASEMSHEMDTIMMTDPNMDSPAVYRGNQNVNNTQVIENINTNILLVGTTNNMSRPNAKLARVPVISTSGNTISNTTSNTTSNMSQRTIPNIPSIFQGNPRQVPTIVPVQAVQNSSQTNLHQATSRVPMVPIVPQQQPVQNTAQNSGLIPRMPSLAQFTERAITQSNTSSSELSTSVPRIQPLPAVVPLHVPNFTQRRTREPSISTTNGMGPATERPRDRQGRNVSVPQVPSVNLAPSEPPVVYPNLPLANPYVGIPRPILDSIAQERDINLVGSNLDRSNQLYAFDNIMPEWIQSIMTKNLENFQLLTGAKLYVFGALNGVNFYGIPHLQSRDAVTYIRIIILMNAPTHPNRGLLPQLVGSLNRNLCEVFAERLGIPLNNLKFIGTADLRTAILNGNTNHIANNTIAAIARRYNLLITHRYSHLIRELYAADNDEEWVLVAQNEPHPMEPMILALDTYSLSQIINTFGITVPFLRNGDQERYVHTNIISYAGILTRGTLNPIPLDSLLFMSDRDRSIYLNKLTDSEIWDRIGVYVPYNSRPELIAGIANSITNAQFMYPTNRTLNRSQNKQTIWRTDVTDTQTFMVCFGTALKYITYELEELMEAFYCDRETLVMEFRRPENINAKFTTRDVEGLKQLLLCFPPTKEIFDLIARIDEGLIDAREKIEYDDVALGQLGKFDTPSKELIRRFLRQLFYTGMYMRRWSGPGTAFPLRSNDTRINAEPDEKVKEQLGLGIELLKAMGERAKIFCLNLRMCQYTNSGGIECGKAGIGMTWNQVIRGDMCIRIASSMFVGTGYHYLRSLFRETIPNMDVKSVDRIS